MKTATINRRPMGERLREALHNCEEMRKLVASMEKRMIEAQTRARNFETDIYHKNLRLCELERRSASRVLPRSKVKIGIVSVDGIPSRSGQYDLRLGGDERVCFLLPWTDESLATAYDILAAALSKRCGLIDEFLPCPPLSSPPSPRAS